MGLSDFERELAANKSKGAHKKRDHERSRSPHNEHRHRRSHHDHHHHRSRRDKDDSRHAREDEKHARHRHKRSRREKDVERERDIENAEAPRAGNGEAAADGISEGEDEWVEKIADAKRDTQPLERDAWMQAPGAMDVEYIQRKKQTPKTVPVPEPEPARVLHRNELNHQLKELESGRSDVQDADDADHPPVQHTVDYTFGDAGSSWRMTRLRAVYRQAEQSGKPVEQVARERYGTLRAFDDAREEEKELDRRKTYGKGYVGKDKPSGELFEQRNAEIDNTMPRVSKDQDDGESEDEFAAAAGHTDTINTAVAEESIDQTSLNKLKAQLMRAKLKRDPNAAALEAEYNRLSALPTTSNNNNTITLSTMDARLLAGNRHAATNPVLTARGLARGTVTENSDMSIADMLADERRTRNTHLAPSAAATAAARIAADPKFVADNEYLDANASRLAASAPKTDAALRSAAIAAHVRSQRALASCPLCHDEAAGSLPDAPVVSLATRTFLTLPPAPALGAAKGSKTVLAATVAPLAHRRNLLECDDDEWEEVRNFMKALTRCYDAAGLGVVFYENAAREAGDARGHACLQAVPLPRQVAGQAPAFFREAVLAAAEEWSQHRVIIDTLAKATTGGMGRSAVRRSLVAEMPYFHVWFALDGGLGHVVEDVRRWPRGDLFAREVVGGMLDVEPEVIRRQGRWKRGDGEMEARVRGFKDVWEKWDWTRALVQEG